MEDIRKQVSEYYSNITTEEKGQMETKICSCQGNMSDRLKEVRSMINPEIIRRLYGCGLPVPPTLEGCTVLDLRRRAGLGIYIASRLVGENGKVINVDMIDSQLSFAREYQDEMSEKFGYEESDVEFKKDYAGDLKSIGTEDESINTIIDSCVIDLSPFKEGVFKEVWGILKKGRELHLSNILADRRVPGKIYQNPVLRSECLASTIYIRDLRRLLRKVGWEDLRYIKTTIAPTKNKEVEKLVGNVNFISRIIRAIRLPGIVEDKCRQYGQFATYREGMVGCDNYFSLGDHHKLFIDLSMAVHGNSYTTIQDTRFGKYFDVIDNRSKHFGLPDGCSDIPAPSTDDCCDSGSCYY